MCIKIRLGGKAGSSGSGSQCNRTFKVAPTTTCHLSISGFTPSQVAHAHVCVRSGCVMLCFTWNVSTIRTLIQKKRLSELKTSSSGNYETLKVKLVIKKKTNATDSLYHICSTLVYLYTVQKHCFKYLKTSLKWMSRQEQKLFFIHSVRRYPSTYKQAYINICHIDIFTRVCRITCFSLLISLSAKNIR